VVCVVVVVWPLGCMLGPKLADYFYPLRRILKVTHKKTSLRRNIVCILTYHLPLIYNIRRPSRITVSITNSLLLWHQPVLSCLSLYLMMISILILEQQSVPCLFCVTIMTTHVEIPHWKPTNLGGMDSWCFVKFLHTSQFCIHCCASVSYAALLYLI